LIISGLIAGSVIGLSLMLMGVMQTLAGDISEFWRVAITANAYAAGFIIIIMARTDLFTEYTTIAVLPLLTGDARASSVARLWGIIYITNLLGGAAFALLMSYIGPSLGVIRMEVYVQESLKLTQQPWSVILASAFVTGWLMGLLAWLVIAARDSISQVFFIWLIASIIAFSHLHHVIIGGVEIFLGIMGQMTGWGHLGHFMLWTSLGNIAGSFVFALLIRYGFLLHRKQ
jgi:formate-nitrite transporter family protein